MNVYEIDSNSSCIHKRNINTEYATETAKSKVTVEKNQSKETVKLRNFNVKSYVLYKNKEISYKWKINVSNMR